jgi:hypothetical protein
LKRIGQNITDKTLKAKVSAGKPGSNFNYSEKSRMRGSNFNNLKPLKPKAQVYQETMHNRNILSYCFRFSMAFLKPGKID